MTEVFYRKWRPRRLDEVAAQEPVTQTLRQALILGRVAHAYLFCGPRGTGKTSTARILAKAVNCLSPEEGEPDNLCEMCQAINEGRALDLIEIDAASNRGIDDIRSLGEKIHFSPNEGRYKVYIIDEVHMLTEPAFNALLKTLEEPPRHAILILATTEAHKVPLTVISRCQRFDFRRIPLDRMVAKLCELCGGEGIEAAQEALALIARTASGSLRDAENLLEQAVVSYGSPVTEERVRELLGLGGDEVALELVGHVVNKSVREGLTLISQVAGEGNDLRQLHRGVLEHMRGALLLKTNARSPLGYPEDTTAQLRSLADIASMEHLVHALKTFSTVDMRRDSFSPLPLELALVEACAELPTRSAAEPPARSAAEPPARSAAEPPARSAAERQPIAARESAAANTSPARSLARAETPPAVQRSRAAAGSGEPSGGPSSRGPSVGDVRSGPAGRLEGHWNEIVRSLRHTGTRFKLGALLRGCRERNVSDGVITLKFPYSSHVERMQGELDDPQTRKELMEVLARFMDSPYEVEVSLVGAEGSAPRPGVARRSHLVRSAQAMGARVVNEKEDESHDEQEDAPPGPAAPAAYDEAPGGA